MAQILIVDDHEAVRTSLGEWLGESFPGNTIRTASSGEEALEAAAATPPDLVLMDIGLPGINGIEATRRLLDRHPATKVIVVSIHETSEHRAAAAAAGAASFIPKRTLPNDLTAAIHGLLRSTGQPHLA